MVGRAAYNKYALQELSFCMIYLCMLPHLLTYHHGTANMVKIFKILKFLYLLNSSKEKIWAGLLIFTSVNERSQCNEMLVESFKQFKSF